MVVFILALTLMLMLQGPKGEALLQTESNETASAVISMAADLPAVMSSRIWTADPTHCLNRMRRVLIEMRMGVDNKPKTERCIDLRRSLLHGLGWGTKYSKLHQLIVNSGPSTSPMTVGWKPV